MAKHEKKRGPKGGIKHQPGRGHDSKSGPAKKKQYARRARRQRRDREEALRKQWQDYDALPDNVKKLLGPSAVPPEPRPKDED